MAKPCPYAVCPGKERCALEDTLANPTYANPRRDDRPETIRVMRECPNVPRLRRGFPGLFKKAGV